MLEDTNSLDGAQLKVAIIVANKESNMTQNYIFFHQNNHMTTELHKISLGAGKTVWIYDIWKLSFTIKNKMQIRSDAIFCSSVYL